MQYRSVFLPAALATYEKETLDSMPDRVRNTLLCLK
jgi:hypothetical protein